MIRYTAYFTGRVQGVGFRWSVRRVAGQYTVAGYVRNLPDGRVHLVAEGQPAELDRFINAIKDRLSENITDCALDKSAANGEFGTPAPGGMDIRH